MSGTRFNLRLRKVGRWAVRVLAALAAAVFLAVLAGRWVNPPITYLMAREWGRLGAIEREWMPLEDMSEHLPLSAAAAEDANFCRHFGFDLDGIRAALADSSRLRGGSTITQQVAKNVYLWPDRSWLRKGAEAGITVLIELTWPKRRIMEVYLNVAEMDAGVFGVRAAARRYWNADAGTLGALHSARLMAVLPSPQSRSPVSGRAAIKARGRAIRHGADTLRADGRAACFLKSESG